jgi:hypothetical protein
MGMDIERWMGLVVGGRRRGSGKERIAGTFWKLFSRTSLRLLGFDCVLPVDGTAHHPDSMQQFCRNVPRHAVSRLRARREYATVAAEFKPGDSLHGFTVKQVRLPSRPRERGF